MGHMHVGKGILASGPAAQSEKARDIKGHVCVQGNHGAGGLASVDIHREEGWLENQHLLGVAAGI